MQWYVVQVKTREEEKTGLRLTHQGYRVYLPLTLADRRRRQNGTIPLFPGYLFCRMQKWRDNFHPVSKTPGVLKIVRMSPEEKDGIRYVMPTPVPDNLIDALKQLETDQGIHMTDHDYKEGERIRILSGPLKDREAIVTGTAQERIDALMEIMGQQQRMRFGYGEVEPIE